MAQENLQNGSVPPGRASGEQPMDAAGKSLADALRLSFRLLSFIMVFFLAALLLTGLSRVQPNQRGVKLLFGEVLGKGADRLLDEGLNWSWPEPVGRVLKVPVDQRTLVIDDFWYHESSKTDLGDIDPGMMPNEGLRPGWDGALFTGDRALVHVKFFVNYKFGIRGGAPDADEIIRFISNVTDAEAVLRAAVANAAIRAAATRTADAILTSDQENFRRKIQELAQLRLRQMNSGILIEQVRIEQSQVPLAAVAAFNAVNSARQEEEGRINRALGEANNMLERTAGSSWKDLVGEPEEPGLLLQYAEVRERGDETAAEKLLQDIDEVLVSNKTTGTAAERIYDAQIYKANIEQQVKSRAESFEKLVGRFRTSPDLMLARLWAEVKEEILKSPEIVKFYLTPSQKIILRLGEDPEVRRQRMREILMSGEEQERQRKAASR